MCVVPLRGGTAAAAAAAAHVGSTSTVNSVLMHMEAFSGACVPGTRPICKLIAFVLAHQPGHSPIQLIYTEPKIGWGRSRQFIR